MVTDPFDTGVSEEWFLAARPDARAVAVPGPLQAAFPGYHGLVWYWANADIPAPGDGAGCSLVLEGVSYRAEVWLNGHRLPGVAVGGRTEFPLNSELVPGHGPSLIAIRLLNPTQSRRIDGLVLADTPAANAAEDDNFQPGRGYNYGGLTGPVRVVKRPVLDVRDVLVVPDPETGDIAITVEFGNESQIEIEAQCAVWVAGADGTIDQTAADLVIQPGTDVLDVVLRVPNPLPWSPARPTLYSVGVRLTARDHPERAVNRSVRTGFRTLRIDENGHFELNGAPFYPRSTHTGNHVPPGTTAEHAATLLRQDLMNAKALGLNMVRFLASLATPEQLDACDEIGLLVYAENRASWPHGNDPALVTVFDAELDAVVRRDRNHPCVVIWGLLNETKDGIIFRRAAAALPAIRALDATRLVLVSSGRWDGDLSIGSVCNPGQPEWQNLWGAKDVVAGVLGHDPLNEIQLGYVPLMGDRHYYPRVPHQRAEVELLRTMGSGEGRVFLSEYGIGSLMHLEMEFAELSRLGVDMRLPEPKLIQSMYQRYRADYNRFGLDRVFATHWDLFDESYRRSSRMRNQGIGLIRSNPDVVGHNITGMLDHAVSGEGLWSFAGRHPKHEMADAMRDALAPVRWCLIPSAEHQFVGSPASVEVVLASEIRQPPGAHRVELALTGPRGPVHRGWLELTVPTAFSLARSAGVFEIPADIDAGTYTVTAECESLTVPYGRQVTIHRSLPASLSGIGRVTMLGVSEPVATWLADRGVSAECAGAATTGGRVVVLGHGASIPEGQRAELAKEIRSGARALLLAEGTPSQDVIALLDALGTPFRYQSIFDWLYHGEVVALPHPIFDDVSRLGLMDWSYHESLAPVGILAAQSEPDDRAAVYLAAGVPTAGGYRSGEVAATWRVGSGSLTGTTFRFDEILAAPAADARLAALLHHLSSPTGARMGQTGPPSPDG